MLKNHFWTACLCMLLFFHLRSVAAGVRSETELIRPFEAGAFVHTIAVHKGGSEKEEVWSLGDDGILQSNGSDNGYIRTAQVFEYFEMEIEWRWPETPANAGVLLYLQEPDRVWPHNIEAQLKHGDAGDFLLVGEGAEAVSNGRHHCITAESKKRFLILDSGKPSAEVTPGQWNHGRIEACNGRIRYWVNGELMSEITAVSPPSGFIGLATLGGPIQYRRVRVVLNCIHSDSQVFSGKADDF